MHSTTTFNKRNHPLTSLTGRWGSGDWWAVRWTFDGKEGHGNGTTEHEALVAAERNAQEEG